MAHWYGSYRAFIKPSAFAHHTEGMGSSQTQRFVKKKTIGHYYGSLVSNEIGTVSDGMGKYGEAMMAFAATEFNTRGFELGLRVSSYENLRFLFWLDEVKCNFLGFTSSSCQIYGNVETGP